MLNYRLGTVIDFHWEFKPVLSYSKPLISNVTLDSGNINDWKRRVGKHFVNVINIRN